MRRASTSRRLSDLFQRFGGQPLFPRPPPLVRKVEHRANDLASQPLGVCRHSSSSAGTLPGSSAVTQQ